MECTYKVKRLLAVEAFQHEYSRAQLARFLSRLVGAWKGLKDFAAIQPALSINNKYQGTQIVNIEKITGSVGRADDFDRSFRPLKRHMRDRWVAVSISMEEKDCGLIQLYKVGDEYFVLDGHHRISIAASQGATFVDAEVWEYLKETNGKRRVKAFADAAIEPAPCCTPVLKERSLNGSI